MSKIKLPKGMVSELLYLPEHGTGYQKVFINLFTDFSIKAKLYNFEYLEIPESVDIEDIKGITYRY